MKNKMNNYSYILKEKLDKKLSLLFKKNRNIYEIIMKKIEEILKNPNHYKNLKAPLNHLKRVHINTNFVLLFSVDENTKTIYFEDFDHHDNIYL